MFHLNFHVGSPCKNQGSKNLCCSEGMYVLLIKTWNPRLRTDVKDLVVRSLIICCSGATSWGWRTHDDWHTEPESVCCFCAPFWCKVWYLIGIMWAWRTSMLADPMKFICKIAFQDMMSIILVYLSKDYHEHFWFLGNEFIIVLLGRMIGCWTHIPWLFVTFHNSLFGLTRFFYLTIIRSYSKALERRGGYFSQQGGFLGLR